MEPRMNATQKSLYNSVRNNKFQIVKFRNKEIVNQWNVDDEDYKKAKTKIELLQSLVIKEDSNIKPLISELEFLFASGNNDNNITISLYSSKLFLDVISCLNICLPQYTKTLVFFIEKVICNKHIAKYWAKKQEFLNWILGFLLDPYTYETGVKISEILLMNTSGIVPMKSIISIINAIYNHMNSKMHLDNFCQIWAILIFDYQKVEGQQIFQKKETLKIKPLSKVITENQLICLHFKDFFKKWIHILRKRIDWTKHIALNTSFSNNILNAILNNNLMENTLNFPDMNSIESNFSNVISGSLSWQIPSNSFLKETKQFTKGEILSMLYINIFKDFAPVNHIVHEIKNHNIYNTYTQWTKIMTSMQSKNKIKENRKQYVTFYKYSTFQSEMWFVLSTLMGSKSKKIIQDKWSELNLIEILSSYIDYLEWGNIFGQSNRPMFNNNAGNVQDESAYHGEGCACDLDTSLKVQYLRLIYTFCCRDSDNTENKLKLWSKYDMQCFMNNGYLEWVNFSMMEKYKVYSKDKNTKFTKMFTNIIGKINKDLSIKGKNITSNQTKKIELILSKMISLKNWKEHVESYNKNDKQIGLLQKFIYKFMQECYYSSAKFWLSSCIEVVLRGNNTFIQTYIACSGLMPCWLYDIWYSKSDQNQILQLSFDILGELIKFNRANFYILNSYFLDQKEIGEFTKKIINKETLVDSNVFLRSIILSTYIFDKNDEENSIPIDKYYTNKCFLCSFIKAKIYNVFLSLITIVKVNDINQTNISCINSALLIWIIQYLKGDLVKFFEEFTRQLGEESLAGLKNISVLLTMWRDFYNYRPVDSASLQHSTMISFNTWREVTLVLLNKDVDDKRSWYYYVNRDKSE